MVATTLLISLGLILAVIIFLWARSFVSEKTQKFDEPVEFACERVQFDAALNYNAGTGTNTIDVVNKGDVPLYGVEVRRVGFGAIVSVAAFQGTTIRSGESKIGIQVSTSEPPLTDTDQALLVPLILGENGDQKVVYTCDAQYGQEVSVQVV